MKNILITLILLVSFTINAQDYGKPHFGNTKAEIMAITNGNVGDMYRPTDALKEVWIIGDDNAAHLDVNKELITVTLNESNTTESQPVHTITQSNGITTIDAQNSTYNGLTVGGSNGVHKYTFTGLKNTVDVLGATTSATLVAGLNTDLVNGVASKNITGNSWNASVYSQESFNPNDVDFAVTVEIESVTGTIREMFGFDDNPTQNNSYSSIEYAVYQVNNYFYSRVYEKGSALPIPNYTTFYFNVGDEVGVKCVDGIVSYFVLRNGVETIIHTSSKKTTVPLYFKAAFNRGNTSSGASALGNVKFYTAQKTDSFIAEIEGNAASVISDQDKEILKFGGIEVLTSATYSNLQFTRANTTRFNGGILPIDLTHIYIGLYTNLQSTITF